MFELIVDVDDQADNYCDVHAQVQIKDLKTQEKIIISFINNRQLFDNESEDLNEIKSSCCRPKPIRLYSDRHVTLEQLKKDLEHRYQYFSKCTNNCSDAVNYTLNYFFPISQNRGVEFIYQTYKALTFPCCLATCGFTPLFGSPPLTNSPQDVRKKAFLLSRYYGDPDKIVINNENQENDSLISHSDSDNHTPPNPMEMIK